MAMLNNQMVRCIKQLLNGVYVAQVATVTGRRRQLLPSGKMRFRILSHRQTVGSSGNTMWNDPAGF